MDCPDCGNQLKPTDKYCTHCGNQVSDSQEKDPQKKKSMLRVIALALLSLLLVAGVAFGTYSFMSHRDAEKTSKKEGNDKESNDKGVLINGETLDIVLPEDERADRDTIVKSGGSITFIIDGTVTRDQAGDEVSRSQKGIIYYYEGNLDLNTTVLKRIEIDSIRQMLAQRNSELLTEINKIKNKWKNGDIDDEQYNDLVKKARAAQAANPNAHRVVVSIKPTANASYADVLRMLDDMEVNQIATFQIEKFTKEDSILYERKTGHPLRN